MSNLSLQKRLAMSLLKSGQRKVWLDPSKKRLIGQAKTREAIRELIVKDVIQVVPTRRGKRTGNFKVLQQEHPSLKGIKKRWEEKYGKSEVKQAESEILKAKSPDRVFEEEL